MTNFVTQYAIRLPNGLIHSYKPSGFTISEGMIRYVVDESAEASPVVYDSLQEAEEELAIFQKKAAYMGITEWLGRIETRLCTPFSNTEPSEDMMADLEKFLEDK